MCDDFMKRKNYIIFFIIFILIFSCGKNKSKEEKEKNDVNIARENEKLEAEKYNGYVQLYNHLLQIDEYTGYYFEVAGTDKKMKRPEEKINIPSIDQSIIDAAKENIAKVPEMKELDNTSRDLLPVLSEMKTLTDQMTAYYGDGNYFKNKTLREEMHVNFLEITKKYHILSKKFKEAFSNRSKEQKRKIAEKIKKEGKLIEYYLMTFIDSCEEILDEIQREKISAENLTDADLAKFKELEAKMTASMDKLKNSAENQEMLKKEHYHSSDFTSFLLYTERFKETVAKFINRVENKEKLDPKLLQNNPSLKNESGTPENVFHEYNELIKEYNKIAK